MKKYKVVFDMHFYNKEFIVEAADKKQAVTKADDLYAKQMGHIMFWYGVSVEEV